MVFLQGTTYLPETYNSTNTVHVLSFTNLHYVIIVIYGTDFFPNFEYQRISLFTNSINNYGRKTFH